MQHLEILESLPAEEGIAYLNTYLEAAYRVTIELGGFKDKVIGVEIMAFRGSSVDHGKQRRGATGRRINSQIRIYPRST